MDYQSPAGPKYINREGPGLRGGTNFGNAGSQGKQSLQPEASGRAGALNTHVMRDGLDNDDFDLREDD